MIIVEANMNSVFPGGIIFQRTIDTIEIEYSFSLHWLNKRKFFNEQYNPLTINTLINTINTLHMKRLQVLVRSQVFNLIIFRILFGYD